MKAMDGTIDESIDESIDELIDESADTTIAGLAMQATALRILAMDCVEHAGSGHPGMPMGMAEIATVLWRRHLRHNPANPYWPNRDRFVLSNGHGSALLYSLLHLSGYDLPVEQLKQFRRLGSHTPGHPEYGCTPGVETTTGPLGQGLANAVGMALAERLLAEEFNTPDQAIVDHRTFVFLGDGCLMEGLSHEACALAGTWQLNKLVAFWDDNGISIDGPVRGWFTDNTPQRFEAYGWHVIRDVDGHDLSAVDAAITQALGHQGGPTLICCKTTIGFGAAAKQGTADCHGSPLGETEALAVRKALDWPHAPFEIPASIGESWNATAAGVAAEQAWKQLFERYAAAHAERAAEFRRRMAGTLPKPLHATAHAAIAEATAARRRVATRQASLEAISTFAPLMPEMLGGSADLASSNLTLWRGARAVSASQGGNYLHYGVREFGMAAIMNGLALHGGFRPFGGTFLVFSDYARNAMRMAALMRLNIVYVLTHDSVGLGADGPTHQPVEHLASLRLMPNMDVWRPCDSVETLVAWHAALTHDGTPTCLVLSRQALDCQTRSTATLMDVHRGAYVLKHERLPLALVLIATGSEVSIAMQAADTLAAQGLGVRVVSMPSPHTFDLQTPEYRQQVLPIGTRRMAIEAGVSSYWHKYTGLDGRIVGIDSYGESGDGEALFKHFGLTAQALVAAAHELLGTSAGSAPATSLELVSEQA